MIYKSLQARCFILPFKSFLTCAYLSGYIGKKKNRSVMAGKAGALCEAESWLMFVTSLPCFYSNQLFLRAEQVSASALRIFSCFTMMPPKGKPSFLLPMPQSQFCLHTGNIQLNILKWGGQKNPELSRTLLGLCFNNSLFQHIL